MKSAHGFLPAVLGVVAIAFASLLFPSAATFAKSEPGGRPVLDGGQHLTYQPELDHAGIHAYARQFYTDDETDEQSETREAAEAKLTQAELWQQMERYQWPNALTNFRLRFQAGKSYIALYKKLPTSPMDMRSPNRFKNSMSSQEILHKSSSIGHMSIGWSCTTPSQPTRIEGFAAQSGERGQASDMLDADWGINALISTFTDGHIQNAKDIQEYFSNEWVNLIESGEEPNAYFAVVIEVPHQDCTQVREFVKSFVLHPSKPYKNFGMMPNPNKYEGAGCGSFAISALAHAPTIAPLMAPFWRTVPIADKLFGLRTKAYLPNEAIPVRYAKVTAEERPIGKKKLILMNWDTGKTALNLHIVDPELAVYAFKKFGQMATRGQHLNRYQEKYLGLVNRFYNFTNRNGDNPDFADKDSGYHEIDENFDPSFMNVSNAIEQWWAPKSTSSQMNLVSFPYGVGVMIDSK